MDDQDKLIIRRSRTPNKDYRVDTPGAGVFSDEIKVPLSHWWHLQDCLGTEPVVIKFPAKNKKLTRNLGQSGDISEGYEIFQLATTTPQTIVFTAGDDQERDERGNSGLVVTTPLGERLYNDNRAIDAGAGPLGGAKQGATFPAGLTKIIDGVAGFKIRVFNYNFSLPVANDFQFYEEDGAGNAPVSARGYGCIGGDEKAEPVFECGDGKQLDVWLLAAGILSVQVSYELVPV